MAASSVSTATAGLSKAEYLKRYMSADENEKKAKGKLKKKRPKVVKKGFKIVDDDVDWRQTVQEEKEVEEEEDEAPVIAEVIDERPDEIIQLENFRTSNKWKIVGVDDDEEQRKSPHDSTELSPRKHKQKTRHDSPDVSPPRKLRHDSPDVSPPRRGRHDSPDLSPPKRARHDSSDVSPPRKARHDSPDTSPPRRARHDSPDVSPPRKSRRDSPDMSPPRRTRHDSPDMSPPRKTRRDNPDMSPPRRGRHDSPDLSPPRHRSRKSGKMHSKDSSPTRRKHKRSVDRDDSDQSPRRSSKMRRGSDSDQSPPRRRPQTAKNSDDDLSPPRRSGQSEGQRMLSGGKAGLVSVDVLRKEKEENRQRERSNKPLEEESRNAHTVFRDKSGKRRNLDLEREEQQKKAGEKAAKDEKYAQWGKGLAQGEMHQQKLEYALQESQKPLARHRDDEDLDRLLREQEREGDPMAAMLRRKKARTKTDDKPRYKGPQPPPNRFNIQPGYRWDGVDRSNGFEQKYFKRIADKRAGQEEAYKWSVEDM